jgi:hypothetical protein
MPASAVFILNDQAKTSTNAPLEGTPPDLADPSLRDGPTERTLDKAWANISSRQAVLLI